MTDQTLTDPARLDRASRAEEALGVDPETLRRLRAEALGEDADRAEAALLESGGP